MLCTSRFAEVFADIALRAACCTWCCIPLLLLIWFASQHGVCKLLTTSL